MPFNKVNLQVSASKRITIPAWTKWYNFISINNKKQNQKCWWKERKQKAYGHTLYQIVVALKREETVLEARGNLPCCDTCLIWTDIWGIASSLLKTVSLIELLSWKTALKNMIFFFFPCLVTVQKMEELMHINILPGVQQKAISTLTVFVNRKWECFKTSQVDTQHWYSWTL